MRSATINLPGSTTVGHHSWIPCCSPTPLNVPGANTSTGTTRRYSSPNRAAGTARLSGRLVDDLVGDPLRDLFRIGGRQTQNDVREASVNDFGDRLSRVTRVVV